MYNRKARLDKSITSAQSSTILQQPAQSSRNLTPITCQNTYSTSTLYSQLISKMSKPNPSKERTSKPLTTTDVTELRDLPSLYLQQNVLILPRDEK